MSEDMPDNEDIHGPLESLKIETNIPWSLVDSDLELGVAEAAPSPASASEVSSTG